jgi:hypothetical protein
VDHARWHRILRSGSEETDGRLPTALGGYIARGQPGRRAELAVAPYAARLLGKRTDQPELAKLFAGGAARTNVVDAVVGREGLRCLADAGVIDVGAEVTSPFAAHEVDPLWEARLLASLRTIHREVFQAYEGVDEPALAETIQLVRAMLDAPDLQTA